MIILDTRRRRRGKNMLIRQTLSITKSLSLPHDSAAHAGWTGDRAFKKLRLGSRCLAAVLLISILGPCQQPSTAGKPVGSDQVRDCSERLKQLGFACLLFSRVNQGKMPASLSELYYAGYITELRSYVCPGTSTELLSREEIDAKSDYLLSPSVNESGTRPLVQDRSPANHGGSGINVFYSDGSVRWEAASAAALAKSAGPASGGGGGAPAAKASPSIPLPLLGLLALLLANIGLIIALVLRRRRKAPSSQNVSARIEIIYPDGGRKTFEIRQARTTIGRAEDNSLVIHDPDVSSHHAEIVISEGTFILRDRGSANGTFLDGEKIQEARLYLGDEIVLGSTKLTIGS
jgi:hypothetical protein